MTKPTIGDLLSAMAASLREVVLPELPAGPARRQLQAAISVIRRVALVWDKTGPYLHADNRDIEETLLRLRSLLDAAKTNGRDAGLEQVHQRLCASLDQRAVSAAEYPSPQALGVRNVELQGLLVELQEALHEPSLSEGPGRPQSAERTEISAALRALFRRMLERELELIAPSAQKK